jgi:cytochrome P450
LSAGNDDHARIRRLLSHGFSERALKEQEPLLRGHFDLLITKLTGKANGNPFNISDWLHYIIFDITGDLEFGESFHCVQSGSYHPWIAAMRAPATRLILLGSILMVLPFLRPIVPYLVPKKLREQRMERFDFTRTKVSKRLSLGDDPQRADFMTYVCRYNNEKGMSRAEIDATFDILVTAGSETTATGMTGILHYLLRYPEQFRKLREEIRGEFGSSEEITFAATAKLTYLNAVINEGLRLCPPTPTMLPRLAPKGGAKVCGYWIPEGVSIPY